ncbi:hypothetical protein ACFL59_09795, partial [Planctomycetota bacterium]
MTAQPGTSPKALQGEKPPSQLEWVRSVADTVKVTYEDSDTALEILDRIGEKEPAIAERMVACLGHFEGAPAA